MIWVSGTEIPRSAANLTSALRRSHNTKLAGWPSDLAIFLRDPAVGVSLTNQGSIIDAVQSKSCAVIAWNNQCGIARLDSLADRAGRGNMVNERTGQHSCARKQMTNWENRINNKACLMQRDGKTRPG
jgi:hypothetical protein